MINNLNILVRVHVYNLLPEVDLCHQTLSVSITFVQVFQSCTNGFLNGSKKFFQTCPRYMKKEKKSKKKKEEFEEKALLAMLLSETVHFRPFQGLIK